MSIHEIEAAVDQLRMSDEKLSTPGFCRYAVKKVMETALQADMTPPHAEKVYLVYPSVSEGERVHYCVRVSNQEEGSLIINTVASPRFPLYIGSFKHAPGLLQSMTQTESLV